MLFTSPLFAFVYLPLVLAGFFWLGRRRQSWAVAWLFIASLVFYGYWMPELTALLLLSIAFNFGVAAGMRRAAAAGARLGPWPLASALLFAGITVDLGLLCYFKYANFLLSSLGSLVGSDWTVSGIVLPIGISFYTFTQIAFLVDTWSARANEPRAVHYGLFVTYFPHLVAGPILHHSQMMPQFARPGIFTIDGANLAGGLFVFTIGLLKKVVLADGVAPYADAVFNGVGAGSTPSVGEAWLGALAYTAQLYFDFSGYSDMAVGLSRMFNIELPFNFNSPYTARSISDFWRRWHISLSNFLRDYLYVPLGGNRKGPARRYLNLAVTMLLGGLWHGASWSFVLWGALHGGYLVIHHGWQAVSLRAGLRPALDRSRVWALSAWVLTFVCVVVAWVPFRAETIDGAGRMLRAMCAVQELGQAAPAELLWNAGLNAQTGLAWCIVLLAVAALAPNSNVTGQRVLAWCRERPSVRACIAGMALVVAPYLVLINATRQAASPFIYFNF